MRSSTQNNRGVETSQHQSGNNYSSIHVILT